MPHFAHADEQLLYTLATQILRDHFVDQATFDAGLAEWGEAGLVDIIGCLGNFSMLAMLLNTFQVDLKPGDPEPPSPTCAASPRSTRPPRRSRQTGAAAHPPLPLVARGAAEVVRR